MISITEVSRGRFTCEAGTESTTEYLSQAEWNGHQVWVRSSEPPCDIHELGVMHHYGPDGKDWGPTGFLWCAGCAGIADDPD